MTRTHWSTTGPTVGVLALAGARPLCGRARRRRAGAAGRTAAQRRRPATWCNDSHFHLTNYVQEGTDIHDFLKIMGDEGGPRRRSSGSRCSRRGRTATPATSRPTYYLQTDAPLYYYSFTDAFIAMAYRSLTPERAGALRPDDHRLQPRRHVRGRPHQARAADVPRRLLGDRRVHDPQGVRLRRRSRARRRASRTRRSTGSSTSPARSGLVVILHNDVDMPFPKPGQEPVPGRCSCATLFKRHPKTTIIWAHCGLGRIVRPVKDQIGIIERALANPELAHVYIDISWDEVAKYLVATPETIAGGGRPDQPLPRPLPVRHRRGRARPSRRST